MANIPIEKKSGGFPLLPVILGALVLLALLFLLAKGCRDNDGQPGDVGPIGSDNGVVNQDSLGPDGTSLGQMARDAFTSVDDIFADSTQWASYDGRSVRLNDVRVTDVVGDSTFYVQANDGRRLFVVLEAMGEDQPGGPPDGEQAVRNGETINLEGTLVRTSDFGRYGLNGADLDRANRMGLMLRAHRISGDAAM